VAEGFWNNICLVCNSNACCCGAFQSAVPNLVAKLILKNFHNVESGYY